MNFRKFLIPIAMILVTAAFPAAAAPPVINEFVANHVGTDTHEFVEILGNVSTDYFALTILEIEGDGSGAGVIDSALPVGSTDAGGLWVTGYMIENGSMTLLLVENFTGAVGDDLDADNDGVFDSMPFGAIIDQVAVFDGGASDHVYGSTVLVGGFDGVGFTPGGASRIPNGTDTDAVSDWTRNDFDGAGLPGFAGTPATGEAFNTPGATNQVFIAPPDPVINEFVFNHTGTDDHEYVEIFGEPSTSYSHLTVFSIDGDGTQAGMIDAAYTVGSTDAAGFWTTPFMTNVLENGSNTLLLVDGFFGFVGQDLDSDDDGVLDTTPFARLVDDVAVRNGNATDHTYSSITLVQGYDGNGSTVGGASRIPNGTDTDTVADWVRNDFDGEGLPGFTGTPDMGEALNTPGSTNLTAIDMTPPVITVSVTPSVLWPPNHKFAEVCATVTVSDDRDPAPTFVLTSIESNEPADGKGDGHTAVDIMDAMTGSDDLCFSLRAERAGGGNGREYTIVYTATDAAGNTAPGMAVVLVPHDQSGMALASEGFTPDGTSLDLSLRRFALVIPSVPSLLSSGGDGGEMIYVEGLDASRIDPYLAYVGNAAGALRPDGSEVTDVTGDNAADLVLYYPTKAVLQLSSDAAKAEGTTSDGHKVKLDGTLGLHFEGPDGTQYLVGDILGLGAPVSTEAGATAGSAGGPHADKPAGQAARVSIQPNPFNPTTTISLEVTVPAHVVLRVFDVRGAVVRTLRDEFMAAGRHTIRWDGRDDGGRSVSSGIYFVRFESAGVGVTHRAVLLK